MKFGDSVRERVEEDRRVSFDGPASSGHLWFTATGYRSNGERRMAVERLSVDQRVCRSARMAAIGSTHLQLSTCLETPLINKLNTQNKQNENPEPKGGQNGLSGPEDSNTRRAQQAGRKSGSSAGRSLGDPDKFN